MAGVPRRNRGTLIDADPLWSKAPLVLLRYPGLFVSIAVGALLLALAASAYPLFISSPRASSSRPGSTTPRIRAGPSG